jgi:hypothetical protein
MVHAALLLLMLEAVTKDLVFTISLKRSTQNLQLSTSWAGRLHHLSGQRTLAARPTTFPAKEQQEGIRESENEDYVEQVEQKHELPTYRCTGAEKRKLSRVGE